MTTQGQAPYYATSTATSVNGGCNVGDISENKLCYVSGTYSPLCISGDIYIPNSNICVSGGGDTISSINFTCTSGYVYNYANNLCYEAHIKSPINGSCDPYTGYSLADGLCYPPGSYPGICNIDDSSYSDLITDPTSGQKYYVYWCTKKDKISIQQQYENNLEAYNTLEQRHIDAAINCEGKHTLSIGFGIPIILILFFIIVWILYKYDVVWPSRNLNRY